MMNHYDMFLIMFISGLLSSMSIWADKLSDVSISLNDVYMSLLMCGWMLFFMAIYENNYNNMLIGFLSVLIIFVMIRKQLFINSKQYILSMIPHHSMAVLMSKRLIEKNVDGKLKVLVTNIIKNQEEEIKTMKNL